MLRFPYTRNAQTEGGRETESKTVTSSAKIPSVKGKNAEKKCELDCRHAILDIFIPNRNVRTLRHGAASGATPLATPVTAPRIMSSRLFVHEILANTSMINGIPQRSPRTVVVQRHLPEQWRWGKGVVWKVWVDV